MNDDKEVWSEFKELKQHEEDGLGTILFVCFLVGMIAVMVSGAYQ